MPDLIKSPNYAHAPIVEAVIDLTVEKTVDTENLAKIAKKLRKNYPELERGQETALVKEASGDHSVVERFIGFRVATKEQTGTVIISPHGLAISRLSPYQGWSEFRQQFEELWDAWRKVVGYNPLKQIGLRYINRFDIPFPRDGEKVIVLDEYTNLTINSPFVSKEAALEHLTRIVVPTSTPPWLAAITTMRVLPPPVLNTLAITLDIDVLRNEDLPQKDNELFAMLDEARLIKNDIFERCITDKTRELIS